MEEFRNIMKIKYNNGYFHVLVNDNLQIYFLKVSENGSYIYPKEEEFIELYKIFHPGIKDLIFNELKIGDKINITPKIIKNGVAIALSALLSLGILGHTYQVIANTNERETTYSGEEVTSPYESENYSLVTDSHIEISPIPGYDNKEFSYINEYFDIEESTKYRFFNNLEEFLEITGIERIKDREIIKGNILEKADIPEEYKQGIIDHIDNIPSDLDLSVLNYNIIRSTWIETEDMNEVVVAQFDSTKGVFYYRKGVSLRTIIHELMHSTTMCAYEKEIDALVNVNSSEYRINKEVIYFNQLRYIASNNSQTQTYYGMFAEEALAERLTRIIMNETDDNKFHAYWAEGKALSSIFEMFNVSLKDFIENGGIELLISKMSENGIEQPLSYIRDMDLYNIAVRNGECDPILDGYLIYKDVISRLENDYLANNEITNNSQESLEKNIEDITISEIKRAEEELEGEREKQIDTEDCR